MGLNEDGFMAACSEVQHMIHTVASCRRRGCSIYRDGLWTSRRSLVIIRSSLATVQSSLVIFRSSLAIVQSSLTIVHARTDTLDKVRKSKQSHNCGALAVECIRVGVEGKLW